MRREVLGFVFADAGAGGDDARGEDEGDEGDDGEELVHDVFSFLAAICLQVRASVECAT